MSTWILASFSYFRRPASAIFQNWLGLLVTKPSFTILAWAPGAPEDAAAAPLLLLLQPASSSIGRAASTRLSLPSVRFVMFMSPQSSGFWLAPSIAPLSDTAASRAGELRTGK